LHRFNAPAAVVTAFGSTAMHISLHMGQKVGNKIEKKGYTADENNEMRFLMCA
jgi:hypothetical protein